MHSCKSTAGRRTCQRIGSSPESRAPSSAWRVAILGSKTHKGHCCHFWGPIGARLHSKMSSFSALQKAKSFISNNFLGSFPLNNIFFRWRGVFRRCASRSLRLASPVGLHYFTSVTTVLGYHKLPACQVKSARDKRSCAGGQARDAKTQ